MARELGLARFGKLSIDGTKVRANASDQGAMVGLLDIARSGVPALLLIPAAIPTRPSACVS